MGWVWLAFFFTSPFLLLSSGSRGGFTLQARRDSFAAAFPSQPLLLLRSVGFHGCRGGRVAGRGKFLQSKRVHNDMKCVPKDVGTPAGLPCFEWDPPTTSPAGGGRLASPSRRRFGRAEWTDLRRCAAPPPPPIPPVGQRPPEVQHFAAGHLRSQAAGQVSAERCPSQAQQARSPPSCAPPPGKSRRFAREHLNRARSAGFMAWPMLASAFCACTDRVRVKSGRLCKPREEEALEALPASGVISAEYFLQGDPRPATSRGGGGTGSSEAPCQPRKRRVPRGSG